MQLNLLPLNDKSREYYSSHSTFHDGDSGLDLFVIEEQTIPAHSTGFIRLGFKASAQGPDGGFVSWLIMPRSSISKTPLRLANSVGLIDAGYRGELMAAVDNIRGEDFTVKAGERLVQAVSFTGGPISMNIVNELNETSRGEGGFGSTNKIQKTAHDQTATTSGA